MHEDIYIYYHPLPGTINEAVSICDGGYNVTIDPRQSQAGILRSYRHAMRHIKKMDFDKCDVQRIEDEAHGREDK